MIETKEVIELFDRLAPDWDAELIRNDEIISTILDNAAVTEGKIILDVACGTGVLIPDYLKRRVASVTGIDISPKMAEIAKAKFPQPEVTILCGDVESTYFGKQFDCIVVYNAFPHFDEPLRLFEHLTRHLRKGGTLTVCHGMSREKIIAHHENVSHVSHLLPEADELKEMMGKYLYVVSVISDEKMYLVSGIKE